MDLTSDKYNEEERLQILETIPQLYVSDVIPALYLRPNHTKFIDTLLRKLAKPQIADVLEEISLYLEDVSIRDRIILCRILDVCGHVVVRNHLPLTDCHILADKLHLSLSELSCRRVWVPEEVIMYLSTDGFDSAFVDTLIQLLNANLPSSPKIPVLAIARNLSKVTDQSGLKMLIRNLQRNNKCIIAELLTQ